MVMLARGRRCAEFINKLSTTHTVIFMCLYCSCQVADRRASYEDQARKESVIWLFTKLLALHSTIGSKA